MHLLRGIDPLKEQSYFLARLSQEQLQRAILPLGGCTKPQTRRMAEKRGLRPACLLKAAPMANSSNDSLGLHMPRES